MQGLPICLPVFRFEMALQSTSIRLEMSNGDQYVVSCTAINLCITNSSVRAPNHGLKKNSVSRAGPKSDKTETDNQVRKCIIGIIFVISKQSMPIRPDTLGRTLHPTFLFYFASVNISEQNVPTRPHNLP